MKKSYLIFVLIPSIILWFGWKIGHRKYLFISIMILIWIIFSFFVIYDRKQANSRELAMVASIIAIGVTGRLAFFFIAPFTPIDSVTIVAGLSFGPIIGFIVGALIIFISNMFFGQGPWTPWQMVALGMIGFIAGFFKANKFIADSRIKLPIVGFFLTMVIYGGIMNPAAALMWYEALNLKILKAYYISGIPYDLVHAMGTFFFLYFGSKALLERIDRVKLKYGILDDLNIEER